jgi:hypothetical protein
MLGRYIDQLTQVQGEITGRGRLVNGVCEVYPATLTLPSRGPWETLRHRTYIALVPGLYHPKDMLEKLPDRLDDARLYFTARVSGARRLRTVLGFSATGAARAPYRVTRRCALQLSELRMLDHAPQTPSMPMDDEWMNFVFASDNERTQMQMTGVSFEPRQLKHMREGFDSIFRWLAKPREPRP